MYTFFSKNCYISKSAIYGSEFEYYVILKHKEFWWTAYNILSLLHKLHWNISCVDICIVCFRTPCWIKFPNWWTAYTWFSVCLNTTTPLNTWHRSLWRSLIKWLPPAKLISVKGWWKFGTWTGWSYVRCWTAFLNLNRQNTLVCIRI